MKPYRQPMNPLLTLSASQLARMIKSKDVTSQEVVEQHIRHIQRVNPILNAVVCDRFEQARDEARIADDKIRSCSSEELPVFHGVPCTMKECFALKGFPQTAGMVTRKGKLAECNATAVERLRDAGFIPMGTTNVPELCLWIETNNRVYGRTNNPYNPRRTAGGSSGGEGSIVGAGGSPIGLGSDIGGSIRMPAFFNGVFGHKATGGLTPSTGQYPVPANQALRYLTTGPLARRAEDLMPIMRILAGPDCIDASCQDDELGDPSQVKMSDLTILNVADNGFNSVCRDLREAQQRVADALSARGAKVQDKKFENLKYSLLIWLALMHQSGGPTFKDMLGEGHKVNRIKETFKWMIRKTEHTLPALLLSVVEDLPSLMESHVSKMVDLGYELRQELISAIGTSGVMLFPSYTSPAPLHMQPLLTPINWVYSAIFNVLEFPATQVPLGLNDQGLPLGVQVVGAPHCDHLTIAVALELEKLFGGWCPPANLQ